MKTIPDRNCCICLRLQQRKGKDDAKKDESKATESKVDFPAK
jgi:hypothetical protein